VSVLQPLTSAQCLAASRWISNMLLRVFLGQYKCSTPHGIGGGSSFLQVFPTPILSKYSTPHGIGGGSGTVTSALLSVFLACSTPYSIRGGSGSLGHWRDRVPWCAQRLTASEVDQSVRQRSTLCVKKGAQRLTTSEVDQVRGFVSVGSGLGCSTPYGIRG
jgi:hypothetical protein